MGAIVLSYPLIKETQRKFPNADIFFLTFKSNIESLKSLNILPKKNILTIREDSLFLFLYDTFIIIKKMRYMEIDLLFDLEFFSRFTTILSFLGAAKKRVGFFRHSLEGLYRGDLLTHKISHNPYLHVSSLYMSMIHSVCEDQKKTPGSTFDISKYKVAFPKYFPKESKLLKIKNSLAKEGIENKQNIFLINVGEGRIPLREWPLANFKILTKKILENKENSIILVGANDASNKSKIFLKDFNKNEKIFDWVGRTSIEDLLTLCTLSKALIANDSGIAHLASLTKIKQFIFFGPESPHIFSPIKTGGHIFYSKLSCSPCLSAYNHRKSSCKDNQCLKQIDPHNVYDIIIEKLI
jgi:ADP-heptose:LPS heptosyltransferase